MGTMAGTVWRWVRFGCLCCVAPVVCLCAGLAVAILSPVSCPEQERVKVGMTADEVREVLGQQPSPHEGYWVCDCPTPKHNPVEVHFGDDGRVKGVSRFDW